MKKLCLLGAVSLFIGLTAVTFSGGQNISGHEGIPGRFVGAWRLVSVEQQGADGKIHRADSTGLLVFTRDGHMSVQVMESNPRPQSPAGPEQYSQAGYEASFGTFEVHESAHTFTFHVEDALVRTLVGKDMPRAFELSGKQLIVKSTHPEEHWKAVWEHY
ncbi:MAG: lipocalin-like domain-containing protein [Candidatus Acidiferrum sp.]